MLSPTADTSATITVTAVGTAQVPSSTTVPLAAGIPTEVELAGLPAGSYTVEVAAEAPVISAVWQATGGGEAADFAWYTAAPEVAVPSLFATPAGPAPVLTLVNTGDQPVTVALTPISVGGDVTGGDTTARELTLDAGSSTTVPLAARAVYSLDTAGAGIRAGISISGDGALAAFPVWPSDAAAQTISVYP
jgi:hypothetical protein